MGKSGKSKKGRSHSTRPIAKTPPPWSKYKPEEVKALVAELGRKGYPPSQIGVILRDQYGIPLVKSIVRKKISEILEEAKLAPKIPEDLANLLRKAENLRKHLEKHRSDTANIHALELLEAKIHRLSKYYRRKGQLPKDWKYEPLITRGI